MAEIAMPMRAMPANVMPVTVDVTVREQWKDLWKDLWKDQWKPGYLESSMMESCSNNIDRDTSFLAR